MSDERIIAANVARIQEEIAEAAHRAHRAPDAVTIVGVTKSVNRAAADALIAAGVTTIAENRVQDALTKFGRRSDFPPLPDGVQLHMIGNAQSNKAKDIVGLFSCVHSLNRRSLADALQAAAVRQQCRLPVLIEVNVSDDPSKEGATPEGGVNLLGYVLQECSALHVQGLMTIAPLVDDPEDARPAFRDLRGLRDRLREQHPTVDLSTLSMGMSNDFPIAVEEGATHVRIGRALFHGVESNK